ncbi:single-stranded DNA-binding protein [Oscillatoria sp. FACHB-1407]|uniref:single-stranded DNA-binding protein n=1 Tax=Oscillatoria sp. FACHB-1407 TaxID=2692847 RepID=UPI00168A2A58|nr:single-stranded DNA-binding protein [Oscillatoria sp. FACHB-1407]MBD2460081.1 single-stranded DNA-binding protein [Oscillatoria sp. FACHB-1407]
MNSFILMAEIIQEPQLRYTSDNQTPIAEMMVQFDGLREDSPPETLRVVGWGNLAQEIQEKYHEGDRIVIEGRLNINTVDRPEGFKEKRAELTAQRIHKIGAGAAVSTTSVKPAPTTDSAPKARSAAPKASKSATAKSTVAEPSTAKATTYSASSSDAEYDDIPF